MNIEDPFTTLKVNELKLVLEVIEKTGVLLNESNWYQFQLEGQQPQYHLAHDHYTIISAVDYIIEPDKNIAYKMKYKEREPNIKLWYNVLNCLLWSLSTEGSLSAFNDAKTTSFADIKCLIQSCRENIQRILADSKQSNK